MTTAATASFRRLPRHADDVWQGGLVRMPTWLEEPDGTLERPWGAVWVSLATGMVNLELMPPGDAPDWDVALRALLGLGSRFMKCRPAGLEVTDKGLGDFLVSTLGDADLSVTVRHDLPAVRGVLRTMARQMDHRPPVPEALEAPEMTIARLRAFAAAARAFHEAAPWRYLSDADLIRVEAPEVAPGLGWLTVLGGAGHTYGLGFFDSEAAFEALQRDPDPEAALEGGAQWSVLFGEPSMLPFAELDLWEEHRLPLAGEAAYPMALRFSATGDHRRPGAAELADIEGILLALARTTQEQVDGGRWRHEVSTHDGPRVVTLAVPDLLVPLDAALPRRGGAADRRAAERVLLEVQRFAVGARFESLEDANAAIQQRFEGFLDDIPSTAGTPLERAQDLAYRAFEARGRRRVLVARKALEVSPDCADAYVILAEDATDPEEACRLYAEGVLAGERALGPTMFAEQVGHFWSIVATRPYLRARAGLAQCLGALGRRDEAIAHYGEILRLNPDDNQGVRYSLLARLMLAGLDDEAGALLDRFGDEPSALWLYGRALFTFRREGSSPAARRQLRDALRANRHAPGYLTGDREPQLAPPDFYSPGSREEAAICDIELGEAWRETAGAAEWLRAHAPRRSGKRKRR